MIDINKSRNNFKKYPTLKQKCDPVIKVQSSHSSNTNNSSGITNTTKTTTATTNHKTNEPTKTHVKDIQAKLTNLTRASSSSANNAVRAANQHFFLIPEFKDQNFLKEECELAHAQVAARRELNVKTRAAGDNRNNNSSNNNSISKYSGSGACNNNTQQLPRLAALPSNGMRRSGGNGSYSGTTATTSTSTTTNTTTTTTSASAASSAGATSIAHKVDIVFNQFKALPKTPKASGFSAPVSATAPSAVSKVGGGGRQVVRPLVHRTIPVTAVTAANAAASVACAPDVSHISYTNKVNNNYANNSGSGNSISSGNNNMHQQLPCGKDDSFNQEHDDIKYIDSDEAPAAATERKPLTHYVPGTATGITSLAKVRVRPKSTIICSSSNSAALSNTSSGQHVFEKVYNYKYTNGDSSAVRRQELRPSGIDSISIKASIEKFNSFSEQKRLPLSSVTLRSQRDVGSGSGSTSNLQHHRHSSDFDNCNLRLPSSSGGSLTRSPYRSVLASGAVAAAPAAKVVTTSMHSTPASYSCSSASRLASLSSSGGANSTNSLPSKTGGSCSRQHEGSLSRSTERASTSSLLANDAVALALSAPSTTCKSALTGSKLQQSDAIVAGDAKKHAVAQGGACESTADSVRSAATTRSVLPPASPSSSRYWDRESSKTSSLSTAMYNHTDDVTKSASDEKSEGLCGLRNIGNTCFMNSVIQCLSHTSELTKFLKTHSGLRSSSSKDQLILQEFAKLIREMWTNNVHTVTPMELKRAFSTKHRMYSDYNQQDAQEFLRFFLDSLHSALNTGVKGEHLKIDDNLSDNKKADLTWEWYARHENSLIRDLFVGQLKSTLKCTVCGNASVTFDPFWDLSVSLPSSNRCKLDACLDLFIREEILDGDEMPTCSRCKTRRKCTKSFCIQRFPKYLVIHLKRFSETRWSKMSNIVEFPTGERELNMGPYGSNNNSSIYYSLYAISNHMGSTAGGHYVALCKHPVSKKWHEFNDNIVSDALSENHLVSSSAYILFYERA